MDALRKPLDVMRMGMASVAWRLRA